MMNQKDTENQNVQPVLKTNDGIARRREELAQTIGNLLARIWLEQRQSKNTSTR